MLRVYLFGAPRVEHDGRDMALRRTKPLALLAYLAAEPQPRDRDALLALLWPEFDADSARNNLRRELSLLKTALGDLLLADRAQVRLNPDASVWVDVLAFRALATSGLAAPPAHTAGEQRTQQLTAAAELYGDEFLAGFSLPDSREFDEWQFFQRESLHQLYGQVLEQLVQAHLASGAVADAIPHARRWVALDPLHESAQRTLMRLYAWAGQHSAALRQYQECVRTLADQLGADPEEETTALHELIRARRLAPPRTARPPAAAESTERTEVESTPPSNPSMSSAAKPPANLFVGRDGELEQVTQLLVGEGECRLLTLCGPGGIGKTRLALEVAAGFADIFADGVCVVQLAPLTAAELLPQTIAGTLGLDASAGRPAETALAEYLRHKHMLLVLDNCEHLVDACAHLAEHLLAACPRLQLLATSREVLGIAAEVTLAVQPLVFPDADALPPLPVLARYEAVRLFVARARAAVPGFALTSENAAAVTTICRRLDGIPLAIELAAARVRLLQVEQIATRLDDRFTLLAGGSRTALPRHQTLRALIDWSYDLLGEPERDLLCRLSVFAGGWSLEAAETIGGAGTLDRLSQLVNKSLVVVEHGGATRYRLLETIRQYAHERLAEAGRQDTAQRQHLAYFRALVEQAHGELRGPEQTEWLDRLADEHGNLRVALEQALATDPVAALEFAARLLWFWHIRGHRREGREWLARALAATESGTLASMPRELALARARALSAAGFLAEMQGDHELATSLREACLALLEVHPGADDALRAATLAGLGGLMLGRGDTLRARQHLEGALELFRARNDLFGAAECLGGLGRAALLTGAYERAGALWRERLALRETIGDQDGIADARANLGTLTFWQGEHEAARALFESSLALFRANGNRWGLAYTAIALGEALQATGDYDASAAQHQAALALGQELRDTSIVAHARYGAGLLARARGDEAGAAEQFEQVRLLVGEAGNLLGLGGVLCALGDVAAVRGDAAAAARLYDEALALGSTDDFPMTTAAALAGRARLACTHGDGATAVALAGKALALRRAGGRHWRPWRRDAADHWGIPAFVELLALAMAHHGDALQAACLLGVTAAWAEATHHARPAAERMARTACIATVRSMLHEHEFAQAWEYGQQHHGPGEAPPLITPSGFRVRSARNPEEV
jgi:predicted ATPase/DNA-binding SARP family transcriptional activator